MIGLFLRMSQFLLTRFVIMSSFGLNTAVTMVLFTVFLVFFRMGGSQEIGSFHAPGLEEGGLSERRSMGVASILIKYVVETFMCLSTFARREQSANV